MNITDAWARSTTERMKPGGDLYLRPLTRAEMLEPLTWMEKQCVVVYRFGELADGAISWLRLEV